MHADLPTAAPEHGTPHLLDVSMFWGPAGGVRRVLSTRHALLPQHGWRHTVLAPGARGPGLVDAGGLPLPGSGGYHAVLSTRPARELIQALRPDVIESADPYTLAWAVLGAARGLRTPTVAFCHSNLPAMAARLAGGAGGAQTRRARWAEQRARHYLVRLYRQFDLVLAPSRTMTERLRTWGVPQARLQPLGVDCRVFDPRRRDGAWRALLLHRLGLAPDSRLLVYVGRFAPEKNLDLLADTARLLGTRHVLLAVGQGPCPPRGDQVRVLGTQGDPAELARLLASGDVFVHAGDQETFGLSALEAMASGLPIVVSAADGLGELAQDAGWAVAGRRPRDWAEAVDAALHERGNERVETALARARAHDWRWLVERLARCYRRLLGDFPPAPRAPAAAPVPALAPGVGAR
jgi:alpha-1,6-mannosyltransferase